MIGGARPIECPSAHGQLKVTGTEVLFSESPVPVGWTLMPKLQVPAEAKYNTTALSNNEHLLIIGKAEASSHKDRCFVLEGSEWNPFPPPGCDCIITSESKSFFSCALLTLPKAAIQNLYKEDCEENRNEVS